VILRYGLDELALSGFRLRGLARIISFVGAGTSMRRAASACARRWSISARSS
jgi:hypothetical protein